MRLASRRFWATWGVQLVFIFVIGFLLFRPGVAEESPARPADVVRALLDAPVGEFDFARAKVLIDRLIDPSIDTSQVIGEVDRMVSTINKMLSTLPPQEASTSVATLKALRSYLYKTGWWNEERAFRYDPDDPLGQKPAHRLLANYLSSRKGNCVSMPILFVILGERLGLKVTLSTAPLHVLVKYTHDDGMTYNLEATSGAGFARDEWYREHMPMTDAAIANGVYLKALSRREAYAVIATSLVDHLLAVGRYEDAIAVADEILEAYPANDYALVKKGTAYYRILQRDVISRYPRPSDIPKTEVDYAMALSRGNQEAFARADALGWREDLGIGRADSMK